MHSIPPKLILQSRNRDNKMVSCLINKQRVQAYILPKPIKRWEEYTDASTLQCKKAQLSELFRGYLKWHYSIQRSLTTIIIQNTQLNRELELRASITYRNTPLDGTPTRRAILHPLFLVQLIACRANNLMGTGEKDYRHLL